MEETRSRPASVLRHRRPSDPCLGCGSGRAWSRLVRSIVAVPRFSPIGDLMNATPGKLEPMDDYSTRYRTHLLFGMPGSGKGTQGAVLGQLPDLIHISMGDIFRKIPKYGRIGREIEQYTSQGRMVPDELTVRIFKRHLHIMEMQEVYRHAPPSQTLDGFPRSSDQDEILDNVHDVVQ